MRVRCALSLMRGDLEQRSSLCRCRMVETTEDGTADVRVSAVGVEIAGEGT